MNKKTRIGIIGGMGPEATADFFLKVTRHTDAVYDQDHLHIIIDSHAQIPDRTKAILNKGEDPTPYLLESAQLLAAYEVKLIAVPCNTSHYFLPTVRKIVSVRIMDMINEVALSIKRNYPKVKKVGLLATSGTCQIGLYREALKKVGLTEILPDKDTQSVSVMSAITRIKAGDKGNDVKLMLERAIQHLNENGAEVIIAGCTEIPLVLNAQHSNTPIIDATNVLAKRFVEEGLKLN